MELITGHHGDTIITAEQWAEYNRMLIGDDSAIVYRSRTSNFCATSTSGLYWTMDTGHLLANGRDIEVDEAETVGTDPTTTYNRIDSIFLEVLRDDTTLVERAEFVLELGAEAEEPIAPDTPTDADDTLTTLLFAIRVADLVVDGEEITSYTDYTEELPGFATYVTQTEHDADIAEVESAYQAADTAIKQEVPWYATSDTAASTSTKVATCNQDGFSLTEGCKVIVKFDYTNTEISPTLNINDTGDIAIVAYGTTAPTLFWLAGDVVEFTYDGTSWVMHPTQGQVDTLNSNLTNHLLFNKIWQTTSAAYESYDSGTISIDCSDYSEFIVVARRVVNSSEFISIHLLEKGVAYRGLVIHWGSKIYWGSRYFSVSNSGLYVSSASVASQIGSTTIIEEINSSYLIPYQLWAR